MQVNRCAYQRAFVLRSLDHLPQSEATEVSDTVELSPVCPDQAFQMTLSLLVASAGLPVLAALAQEVGRELVTSEQEAARAELTRAVYREREKELPESVASAWSKVREVTDSPHQPPVVVDTPLVFAQADTLGMRLGRAALENELADPNVLLFTLAHEEAHRQHRDTAGSRGLEVLIELAEGNLGTAALQALHQGRQDNELQADLFAAQVCAELGCDPKPILAFLEATEGDTDHASGSERARAVAEILKKEHPKVPTYPCNRTLF